MTRSWIQNCLGALILAAFAAGASALDVQPGMDLFTSPPGPSFQNFAPTPIPPGFFGPGSDPFDGIIHFRGQPLGASPHCPGDNLSQVDTIVRRLDALGFPSIPSTDVIPIEIVALNLVSVQPITVTYNGGQNPQPWNVVVGLSQVPSPQGTMTATKTHPNGGTFDSVLPVQPRFVFTPVGGGPQRVLDTGILGMQPVTFGTVGVPWVYGDPPAGSCTSNFCVNPNNLTIEQAQFAAHGVLSICPEAGQVELPATRTWMLVALVLLVSGLAAATLRRRPGTA